MRCGVREAVGSYLDVPERKSVKALEVWINGLIGSVGL